MGKQLVKEDFVQAYICNRFSDSPKSQKEVALKLGISAEHFSMLKYQYRDEIAKAAQHVRNLLLESVVDHLINRLKKEDCPVEIVRIAVGMTGEAGDQGAGITGNNILIYLPKKE